MCAVLPDGEPVPASGLLPDGVRAGAGGGPFGIYLHVPFCATRCGYCDFNTYTAAELGGGVSRGTYALQAAAELRLARQVLGPDPPRVDSIFVGGGTPTLLPPSDLVALLADVDALFGLSDGAEVTTEANPESVDPAGLAVLREGGFTRISIGMQSAVPPVLATLDRTHTPGRAAEAVREARAAGFTSVSLDLIYGTPGETAEDWDRTLEAALAAEPDHVSAYGLIVEPGTRLAAQVRRGELPAPDEDTLAERYARTEEALSAAGLQWYEVCNWARADAHACRHNLGYWDGGDWWGVGPGAHSHVGGVRWWNVLHPTAHAEHLTRGRAPVAGRELLTDDERRFERVMLASRLRGGVETEVLSAAGRRQAARLAGDGLLDPVALAADRVVLTLDGRQKADLVVRELTD